MADHDVTFEFGGSLDDAEAGRRLVAAVLASDFSHDWGSGWADHRELVAVLEDCAMMESDVTLVGKDVRSTAADGLAALCRELGFEYRISIGESGDEGYDVVRSWKPGMEDEISQEGADPAPTVSLADLETALSEARDSNGLDPIEALAAKAQAGIVVVRPFKAADGILVRLEALSEDELSQPLADAPTPGF